MFYLIRVFLTGLRNILKRIQSPPEYFHFILDEPMAQLSPSKRGLVDKLTSKKKKSLYEFKADLKKIQDDSRVRGVIFHVRATPMPLAHIQSLRNSIKDLRAANKKVVAWSSNYSFGSYYLASAANEVLIQPGGAVGPLGMRRGFAFFADGLRRIGIEADFVQISPYKSAGDMFTKSKMTKEVKEMMNWLTDSAFDQIVEGIAEDRNVSTEEVRTFIDSSPFTDLEAIETSLFDAKIEEEELPNYLSANGKRPKIKTWDSAKKSLLKPMPVRGSKHVALIRIEGSIVDGKSKTPPIPPPLPIPGLDVQAGDLTVVQHARKIASNKRAAAVVVYVDSPGGSATASEAMAAALGKIAAKKPLVVCMGNVAASGGYYVSTPAQYIIAADSTITGSIGVLSGKFVTADLWKRMEVNREVITRGARIDMSDSTDKFTKQERDIMWRHISRIYDVFVDRVAKARNKTNEEVDAIGGGRVWTGRQALENGLVDELGDLNRAIDKAKELAGLGPKTPVRQVRPSKRDLAPITQKNAAGMFLYFLESAGQLTKSQTLCISTVLWEGQGGIWL